MKSTRNIERRAEQSFEPPATYEAAEFRRLALIDRQNEIQTQLGDRNRMVEGRRQSANEFWEWRSRATVALRHVQAELRYLNLWLKQQRRGRTADKATALGIDPADPVSLLLAAANVVQRLRSEGVDLEQDELDVFDAIKDFLQHGPPSASTGEGSK